jgi:hypothetical protein
MANIDCTRALGNRSNSAQATVSPMAVPMIRWPSLRRVAP